MKITSLLLVMLTALFLSGCEKDQGITSSGQTQPTITEGVHGTLIFREGNCMPIVDPNVCKEYPVKRKIYIYEAVDESAAAPYPSHSTFYVSVNSNLVATAESNESGFYQLSLAPGKYSIFIKEDGKLWANGHDGEDHIMPVTVTQNALSQMNIVIDYKAAY